MTGSKLWFSLPYMTVVDLEDAKNEVPSFKDIENKVPSEEASQTCSMQVEAAGVGKITKQNTPADVKPR